MTRNAGSPSKTGLDARRLRVKVVAAEEGTDVTKDQEIVETVARDIECPYRACEITRQRMRTLKALALGAGEAALHPRSPFRDRLAKHRGKIYLAEAGSNVASWLQADIQSPKIDFCFTPNSGHSEAHAGLPVLTHSRHGGSDRTGIALQER